jgi:hypothetical protein
MSRQGVPSRSRAEQTSLQVTKLCDAWHVSVTALAALAICRHFVSAENRPASPPTAAYAATQLAAVTLDLRLHPA